jgi:hypothetical protein
MRKLFKTLILILILTCPFSLTVKAQEVTDINELIEKAQALDGCEITIQGEAIGERMDRGSYSWVNLNDGTNAIGIWLDKSEAVKIERYGNYKNKGDTVKITGIFNRACKEHGGEADLHGDFIIIVEEGYPVEEQIPQVKIVSAIVLIVVAILMVVIFRKRFRKKVTN